MDDTPLDQLTVALVQAELRWQDTAGNRDHLSERMDAVPGADLYVLPETFSTGFLGDVDGPVETMEGSTVAWMREQATSRSAAIAGSLALVEAGQRYNRFLFVTNEGVLASYDKRHLFGFGGEDRRYRAGQAHTVVAWRGWRIDLQTCYDLRFPVWCRTGPGERAYDLQIFVANWPSPRVEAWRTLLKARAIENQSYVLGVNRTGQDGNNVKYPGRSSAWNPLGDNLVELGDEEESVLTGLSLERLREIRQRFPFLLDADEFQLGSRSAADE